MGDGAKSLELMANSNLFPGGPTCRVGDVDVPALVGLSPSGGITSELLAKTLKYIDDHEIHLQIPNIPTPCIILNCHSSQL